MNSTEQATISQAIAAALETWNYVGLRYDSRDMRIGEPTGVSQRWDDDQPTGAFLQGISAINAELPNALELIRGYRHLGSLYLVACDGGYLRGEDEGEIEMYSAVVVARF